VPQVENFESISVAGTEFPASPTIGQRFDFVASFLHRQYLIILICLLLCLPIGALRQYTAPPTYTASATMMIETRQNPLSSLLGDAAPDAAWIESQIAILKSQNVAAYAVKMLRLAEDPAFANSEAGLLDKILARFGWRVSEPKPNSEAERFSHATAALVSQLDARRVGQSYMIRIDVGWHNPEQATKIANAMVDAYIFEQLNAKYQANRRAGDWLQERLQALREQAASAERAVIEFKAKNNIVKAGGSLMSDKQLSDNSSNLSTARAHTSDVEARLERVVAVRQAYQQDRPAPAVDEATVSEVMNNGIINGIRTRYLDMVNREAEWSVRYGKNHIAVVNLRNQIRDARTSIRDELGRIEQTLKSEYEIAKKRQDELEKGLASLVSQSTETNQAQIALFSLESAAQSYRKIYENFLQRHTESVQQQSYPISDARALSPASVSKTGPNAFKIWMVTIFAGGMLGFGIGTLREIMDRGFRTREQVRSVLDTECLALVPLLTDQSWRRVNSSRQLFAGRARKAQLAISGAGRAGPRSIRADQRILRNIIDAPSSPYAEAIRAIKMTVDLNLSREGKVTKVLGLTSCLPSEGKSTIAAAMATLIAQSGARVILVDCDLRNPTLSRSLTPDASVGFLDVVAGKVALADAIWSDPTTNMAFLPAVSNPLWHNATETLGSEAARSIFTTLQIEFDYVVVDLAPLVAALDVRATAHLIDSYVLVIEWGTTKVDAVQYALRHAPGLRENIVGTVLNKVDMAALGRYDSYGARYYYGHPSNAA
jgi:succinoglycan biosynthesis transport protein ExoP